NRSTRSRTRSSSSWIDDDRGSRSPMIASRSLRAPGHARRSADVEGLPWLDAMVMPSIAVLTIVVGYPIVYTLLLSAQDYNLLATEPAHFVGVANYPKLFADPTFVQ